MNDKPRVLVAEDESIIALDLKSTLEKWGFNVEATFRTGEGLLRFAQADDPQILIIDIFLEGNLDGITAAKEVLKTNKIPVIFLTGVPDIDLNKLEIGGRYEFLQKPFTREDLKNALRKLYPPPSILILNIIPALTYGLDVIRLKNALLSTLMGLLTNYKFE